MSRKWRHENILISIWLRCVESSKSNGPIALDQVFHDQGSYHTWPGFDADYPKAIKPFATYQVIWGCIFPELVGCVERSVLYICHSVCVDYLGVPKTKARRGEIRRLTVWQRHIPVQSSCRSGLSGWGIYFLFLFLFFSGSCCHRKKTPLILRRN